MMGFQRDGKESRDGAWRWFIRTPVLPPTASLCPRQGSTNLEFSSPCHATINQHCLRKIGHHRSTVTMGLQSTIRAARFSRTKTVATGAQPSQKGFDNVAGRPVRALQSIRGWFSICLGGRTGEKGVEDEQEPLLEERPRMVYVPRHASASFLKTATTHHMRSTNSVV